MKFAAEPEDKYPLCTSCESVVPDEYAAFCNRCGAKLVSGHEPGTSSTIPAGSVPALSDIPARGESTPAKSTLKAPGSVIITKKKHFASHPAKDQTGAPHDPTPDLSQDIPEVPLYLQGEGKYADETTRDTRPLKKYAHLPLIADELKVKDSPQGGFLSNGAREPPSSHQKKHAPKKGILGVFRR
jgi:hypothetical protein